MSGFFLYFLEGHASVSADTLAARLAGTPIEGAIPSGAPVTSCQTVEGPDGLGGGCVFSVPPQYVRDGLQDPDPICHYKPKEQTWLRMDGCAVGYWNERKPTGADLFRDSTIPGYLVKLNDGSEWQIPLVRRAEGDSLIPRVMKRKPNGSIEYKVVSRYENVCQVADDIYGRLWKMLDSGVESESVDLETLMTVAEQALAINYHVGPSEIALLELLTTDNVVQIAQNMADLPGMVRLFKSAREAEKND